MRIIFLGAPGTGKGTQSALTAEHFHVPLLAASDVLRAAIAGKSILGRQAKAAMDAGQIVSEEIVIGIFEERISADEAREGFVLDGYPRTLQQAEALEQMIADKGFKIDAVILLSGDAEELTQRLVGRRTCRECGTLFNTFTNPPMMDGQCDLCGGRLSHRPDDNDESVSSRLRFFVTQTVLALEHYRHQGKLFEFDASLPIEELNREIQARLSTIKKSSATPHLADVQAVFDTIRQEQEESERAERGQRETGSEQLEGDAPVTQQAGQELTEANTRPAKKSAAKKKVSPVKKGATKKR